MLIADTRTNTTIVFREIHKAIPTHAYVFTRNSSLQTAENNKTHSTDQCLLISSILLVHEKFARRTIGKQQKRRFILLIPSNRCKQIIYIISTSWKYTFLLHFQHSTQIEELQFYSILIFCCSLANDKKNRNQTKLKRINLGWQLNVQQKMSFQNIEIIIICFLT